MVPLIKRMIIAVSRQSLGIPEWDFNPPDTWRVVVDRASYKHSRYVSFLQLRASICAQSYRIDWPDGPVMIVALNGDGDHLRVRLEFEYGWMLFDETATKDTAWPLNWQKASLK